MNNVLCVTICTENTTTISKRTEQMLTINLVSLTLKGHINAIVNYCDIKAENYQRLNWWLRQVIIVKNLAHFITAAASQKSDLYASS